MKFSLVSHLLGLSAVVFSLSLAASPCHAQDGIIVNGQPVQPTETMDGVSVLKAIVLDGTGDGQLYVTGTVRSTGFWSGKEEIDNISYDTGKKDSSGKPVYDLYPHIIVTVDGVGLTQSSDPLPTAKSNAAFPAPNPVNNQASWTVTAYGRSSNLTKSSVVTNPGMLTFGHWGRYLVSATGTPWQAPGTGPSVEVH